MGGITDKEAMTPFFLKLLFGHLFLIFSFFIHAKETNLPNTLESKIWIWPNALQIQFIDPLTKASVIVGLKYDKEKTELRDYEVIFVPDLSGSIPDVLKKFENIETLPRWNFILNPQTIIAFNIYGSRHIDFDNREPSVFVPLKGEDYKHYRRVSELYRYTSQIEIIFDRIMPKDMKSYLQQKECFKYLNS